MVRPVHILERALKARVFFFPTSFEGFFHLALAS